MQKLNQKQLAEYDLQGKIHMNLFVEVLSKKDLAIIKEMHERGYTIYAHDDTSGAMATPLDTIQHLDSFIGASFNPNMIFIALDTNDNQHIEEKERSMFDILTQFTSDFPLHRGVQILPEEIKEWIKKENL